MADEREYYSVSEAAVMVGRSRGTVYNRIKLLRIQTHKFSMDKKTYIAAADVEKIQTVIEKPWMAGQLKSDSDQAA